MSEQRKILIVDDDPDLVAALSLRLRRCQCTVVQAADAMAAVQVARKEMPDLIVLDLGLPAGGGLTVLERLKKLSAVAQIPVVILSGAGNEMVEAAADLGAQAFFHKPAGDELTAYLIKQLAGGEARPEDAS